MRLEKTIKLVLAPLGIVLAVLSLVYGAFLPFRKAQLFIAVMQQAYQSQTIGDYEATYNKALGFYSPVGQAEDVRFLLSQISSVIVAKPPQDVSDALVRYADQISRVNAPGQQGLNYTQELVTLATIHEANFHNYHEQNDYNVALSLYEKGLQLSSKRPQFLYGLFQLYMDAGDTANEKAIGEKILSLWPTDTKIEGIVNGLGASSASSSAK